MSRVSEFAARPHVKNALATPDSPQSVLTFFLGFDTQSPTAETKFEDGSFIAEMSALWFGGGAEYDRLCQPFAQVIRSAADRFQDSPLSSESSSCPVEESPLSWNSVQGQLAQLILFDQLTRNCFRGKPEAFAHDEKSLHVARRLARLAFEDHPGYFSSFTFFLVLAFQHSEKLPDHELGLRVIDHSASRKPALGWSGQKAFLNQHTEVLRRFGRYPHRNPQNGRQHTQEEAAWLRSDDVPGWARSQGG